MADDTRLEVDDVNGTVVVDMDEYGHVTITGNVGCLHCEEAVQIANHILKIASPRPRQNERILSTRTHVVKLGSHKEPLTVTPPV